MLLLLTHRRLVALSLLLGLAMFGAAMAQTPPPPAQKVAIDLIADKRVAAPGQFVWLALRQKIEPGWHTYWSNPGDSGEATKIDWKLPDGFTASPIRWPIPDAIPVGTLLNHGYSDEVLLLSEVRIPENASGKVSLSADATWLVCREICIPEEGSASLELEIGTPAGASEHAGRLAEAVSRLPKTSPWTATFTTAPDTLQLTVAKAGLDPTRIAKVHFFPNEWGQIVYAAKQPVTWNAGSPTLSLTRGDLKERPVEKLSGLLVIDEALDGNGNGKVVRHGFEVQATTAGATPAAGALTLTGAAPGDTSSAGGTSETTGMSLWQALLFAVVGGLILNLMPCVFPVLSLKALAIAQHGDEDAGERKRQGLSYLAGVLASFAVAAAVLLALRATGEALGWGFQFQSPLFVLGMAALFFALGLNLSGVFLIGTSVTNLGSALSQRGGTSGSFFTGVLASVAATPCTAPFMGAALGYALVQPALVAVVVLLALGLGFALPVVALSFSSTLARLLPKPGPWMETLKQVLAFPLYATTAWLVWVLSIQSGSTGVLAAGVVLLAVAFVAWLLGEPSRAGLACKAAGAAIVLGAAIGSYQLLNTQAGAEPTTVADAKPNDGMSEPFSLARLDELRRAGKPVFVNFTAAWCITCKVNEQVALSSDGFRQALLEKNVTYLKGDWTRKDAEITSVLQQHGRAGVPLYLFYDGKAEPEVLPQLLTPSLVTDRFAKLPSQTSSQRKPNGDQS